MFFLLDAKETENLRKQGSLTFEEEQLLNIEEQKRRESISPVPTAEEERQQQELVGVQEEQRTGEQEVIAQLESVEVMAGKLERFSKAGNIPISSVLTLVNNRLADLGLREKTTPEETLERLQSGKLSKGIGLLLGTVGQIEILDFSIDDLYSFRNEIGELESDLQQNNVQLEANLRSLRDSKDPHTLSVFDALEDSTRLKLGNLRSIMKGDADSTAKGATLNDTYARYLNRVISDKAVAQRFLITNDPTEINNRLLEIEAGRGQQKDI